MMSYDTAIKRFSAQYKNVPGILEIERDGFFSDAILVFVDRNKFKGGLPSSFNEFDISLYDVQHILSASNKFLSLSNKLDLTNPQNKSTLEYFKRAAQICNEILSK